MRGGASCCAPATLGIGIRYDLADRIVGVRVVGWQGEGRTKRGTRETKRRTKGTKQGTRSSWSRCERDEARNEEQLESLQQGRSEERRAAGIAATRTRTRRGTRMGPMKARTRTRSKEGMMAVGLNSTLLPMLQSKERSKVGWSRTRSSRQEVQVTGQGIWIPALLYSKDHG